MSRKCTEDEIKQFIIDGCIEPYYQPIREYGNDTNYFTKFEVLARLEVIGKDGKIEEIAPYYFIKLSKELKIYSCITRQIVQKSFKKINDLVENHPNQTFKFSVNIQMDDIRDERTVRLIESELVKYGIARNIIFELSEEDSLTGEDSKKTEEFIKTFKGNGSEFALDDFGTGYSSFHPLIEFDFDYIKFDQILIQDIYKKPKNYYLCDLLVDFSERNNLKTIAEFVEDEDHEKALEAVGIKFYQGYKYSKAVKCINKFIK